MSIKNWNVDHSPDARNVLVVYQHQDSQAEITVKGFGGDFDPLGDWHTPSYYVVFFVDSEGVRYRIKKDFSRQLDAVRSAGCLARILVDADLKDFENIYLVKCI